MQFQEGRMYVRMVDGTLDSVFFTVRDVKHGYRSFPIVTILRVSNGETLPVRLTHVECAQPGTRCKGQIINFSNATDANLRNLIATWSNTNERSPTEWAEAELREECDLLPGEKERLRLIAKDYS